MRPILPRLRRPRTHTLYPAQASGNAPLVCRVLQLTFQFIRSGTGRFSTTRLSLSLARRISSVTTSTRPALSHLAPPNLHCSTSLASTQYELCSVYAVTMGSHLPPAVANSFVFAGFQRLVLALPPPSHFVSSTSSTSFRRKAKLISTTSIPLSLL